MLSDVILHEPDPTVYVIGLEEVVVVPEEVVVPYLLLSIRLTVPSLKLVTHTYGPSDKTPYGLFPTGIVLISFCVLLSN